MSRSVKLSQHPEWSEIQGYPVVMYQTIIKKPLIGLADPRSRRWDPTLNENVWGVNGIVRLWAPAEITAVNERNVVWTPLAYCEEFMDLRIDSAAIYGSHPVPDVIREGYKGFVENFMQGNYKMKPVVANLGVEGPAIHQEK